MLLLFQIEFVWECRLLHQDNMEEFLRLIHGQREKCGQSAAMQRVSHSLLLNSRQAPSITGGDDDVDLLTRLNC